MGFASAVRTTDPAYTFATFGSYYNSLLLRLVKDGEIKASDIILLIDESIRAFDHVHRHIDYSYVSYGNTSTTTTTYEYKNTTTAIEF